VEESKEPRPEGSQEAPVPSESEVEESGPEPRGFQIQFADPVRAVVGGRGHRPNWQPTYGGFVRIDKAAIALEGPSRFSGIENVLWSLGYLGGALGVVFRALIGSLFRRVRTNSVEIPFASIDKVVAADERARRGRSGRWLVHLFATDDTGRGSIHCFAVYGSKVGLQPHPLANPWRREDRARFTEFWRALGHALGEGKLVVSGTPGESGRATAAAAGQQPSAASQLAPAGNQPEEMGLPWAAMEPDFREPRGPVALALAAAVVAFAAVGIFVLGMFTHSVAFDNGGGATVQVVPTAQEGTGEGAQPTPAGPVDVSVDDDPAQGPEDAAVTIIEFSDFQCPYCARFQSETLPQILSNYGDRVRFVYRDFPLTSLHANALKAAEASECADDQGAYWKYHDLLFQNQSALDDASLKNYAASLGLDTAAFDQCLDSDSTMSEIQNDYQDGVAAGVQGTPAFFVNGNLIEGAQPYSVFQAAIEAALAKGGG